MEASGYSKDYIYRFRKEIQWILSENGSNHWESYGDVYHHYKTTLKPSALEKKHAIIGAIEQFDLHGKYPDSKHNSFEDKSLYQKLIPGFKELIDYYIEAERERGKKDSTILTESHIATNFLISIQNLGFNRLNDITEEAIMSIFVSPEGKQLKYRTYRGSVIAFFKACTPINPDACKKISDILPKNKKSRKTIQYLTAQEVKKIRKALDDMSNSLSLRDRAIGKLMLYTGLRRSDISALDMTSIDLENDLIKIRQQKTGNPLEIKLTAVVGNAIYDYVFDERPSAPCPAIFLSSDGYKKRIGTTNIGHISARIMKAAGIRQTKGERKGCHIFRHNFATTLLSNEVSQVVISHAMGHLSPTSTEIYLSADFVHLKECALDISHFPVSKEVFGFE
jgi:integrase